jgi:PhnB protein
MPAGRYAPTLVRMQIPEQYAHAVIPHIMIDGAAEAIKFYTTAFGASEHFRLHGDDGRIVHAEISIEGSTLMLGDADPPFVSPDADRATARAVAAGAELLSPPADMSYGARQSMLRDPFGHVWIFLTPLPA